MKKILSKALAILLSGAMAFTMMAAPVFADELPEDCGEAAVEENMEESGSDAVPESFDEGAEEDAEIEEPAEDADGEETADDSDAEIAGTEEPAEDADTEEQAGEAGGEEPAENSVEEEILCDESETEDTDEPAPGEVPAIDVIRDEDEEPSDIDKVKEMISKLPNCTDVTEADREQIEAAEAAYSALSAEDQAALDKEVGTYAYNSAQPYGRVLEVALWGLWSYNAVDDSTALPDGTYDETTVPALSSEYSKGKSTSPRQKAWYVKEVTVENGEAVATITVESDTYPEIWMGGRTYQNTSESGNCEFTGIPIDLNGTFYFAGVSSSMPVPIAFSLTTSIDESGDSGDEPDEPDEDEADYSAVEAALAKVPEDLSIYTDESAQAVKDAVAAVVYGKKASEQEEVDAMAKAIEDAVAALVLKDDGETERIDLTITNNTGMFKALTAYILKEGGREELVIALSATGYHELFKGTYEQAVANGDGTADKGNDAWVHGYLNPAGKWEFRIPLEAEDSYVPCVAISNTYYEGYLKGSNTLERAFFPRQFTLDREAKTLVTDDYNETADYSVTSNVVDFKVAATASTVVVGGPNSNNYSVSPTLVMEDGTYDEVIFATVTDGKIVDTKVAIKDGRFEISLNNAPGIEAFKDKEAIVMKFRVSSDAPYKAAGEYVKRTVTIDKMAKTIVIDGTPLAEKDSDQDDDTVDPDDPIIPDDDDDQGGDEYTGDAPSVDSSTTLPDGEYYPDSFSWSGGSGKLAYIRCLKITVINGQAYATIEFSSSSYDALKAAGSVYYKQGGGNSVFTIPVNLNANNTIIGRTTAMSQAHWVEYTIYIGLAEADGGSGSAEEAKQDAAEAKMTIGDEAPVILGLKALEDQENAVEYSKYFRIFSYEQGVRLISIDISEDTALREEYTKNAEEAMEAGKSDDDVEYDDEGNVIARSRTEIIEKLYRNNVVNYLLVPEDLDVPAGLDKDYIIITIPAEKTFAASPEALAMMEDLGCLDAVSLLGIDEKDIQSEPLKKALESGETALAGNVEKFDYAKVVKDGSGLAILPGALLPEAEIKDAKAGQELSEEAKVKKENLEKIESRFTTLGVPVIIDRSAQEKEDLAKAEWIKVYGALYGCEDLANEIFDKLVEEAN